MPQRSKNSSRVCRRPLRVHGQEQRHVVADAAAADDNDALAGLHRPVEDFGVSRHAGIIAAGNIEQARGDTGRDNDLVEIRFAERIRIDGSARPDLDTAIGELRRITLQREAVILLAGDIRRQHELSADLRRGFEQRDVMAATSGLQRSGDARDTSADHGNALGHGRRRVGKLVLAGGARIDETGDDLIGEVMVEAGLVAGDADVDEIGPAAANLVDELGIRQQRPRHRHQIGRAVGDHLRRDLRKIDAVARRDRYLDDFLQPARGLDEGGMRDGAGDGRHGGFVPADAGGETV